MSKMTSYAPGTPSWVDLSTGDIEASASFYGDLLGWQVPELPNSAEMGGYRRATLEGDDVAGMVEAGEDPDPNPATLTLTSTQSDDATACPARISRSFCGPRRGPEAPAARCNRR